MKRIILLFATIGILSFDSFAQSYFNINKDYPCNDCPAYTADFKLIKHYTRSRINTVFDSICKSGIEFKYPQGGCQNRAQMMAMLLSKEFKIQFCRIWLFAPVDFIIGDKRTLEIVDKNEMAPDKTIKWNYHVAPCVLVDNSIGKVDTLIIDPSLDGSQPLKISDWLKIIGNSKISKYTFTSSKYYFFYIQNNVISGKFYEYSPTTFCTDVITDVTLEKGLAENDMVIYILNKYLKTTPFDSKKFNAFKPFFGEVTVLENNFLNRIGYCGKTVADNASFRTLVENYPDIVSDAMKVYYEKLIYWTQQSDKYR